MFLLFTYYFPLSSLFLPYYFPIYNFLILPYYCPICLPGFQNDKLRHLEWLCFDCHAKCLKPAKIHIIWFPTKILDFTVFWWHFPKKNDYRNPKMMTLPDYSNFFVHPLATLSTVMLHVWNLQKRTNWIATLLQPQKVVPTVFARYSREQLGKYTGKLVVTTDPGIRVWYGMVVYQKDDKTCEGSPLSALQAYNQIISLWFSYYFPSCSLLFPYFSPIVPYCFYYLPIISLLVPYFCPIISLYIISLFYPIIIPYASQVSKTINLDI